MVSSATAQRSANLHASKDTIQKNVKPHPTGTAKRKRDDENGASSKKSNETVHTASRSHDPEIKGRVAAEIKAALTDALDAFNAVKKVIRIRETLYLKARFCTIGRHDLRSKPAYHF